MIDSPFFERGDEMSISSTVKKIMPYIKTTSGYVLHRLSSQAVEMDDGTTLEEKVTALNNLISQKVDTSTVVNNLLTTEAGFVLDARQGKTLNDSISDLSSKIPEEDNGYLKFVDGTLIQWGSDVTSNTNAVKVINLQIPFIDNSYFVTYQFTRNANTVTRSWIGDAGGNEARTEDNFGIYIQRSSGTSAADISWAAIGGWK